MANVLYRTENENIIKHYISVNGNTVTGYVVTEPKLSKEEIEKRVQIGKIIGAMKWMGHTNEEIRQALEKLDILDTVLTDEQALRHYNNVFRKAAYEDK